VQPATARANIQRRVVGGGPGRVKDVEFWACQCQYAQWAPAGGLPRLSSVPGGPLPARSVNSGVGHVVAVAPAVTDTMQVRIRVLPSRVVEYLLLAAALFTECGYPRGWAQRVTGVDGMAVATTAGFIRARHRIGAASLRASFDLLRRPVAGPPRRSCGGAADPSPRSTAPRCAAGSRTTWPATATGPFPGRDGRDVGQRRPQETCYTRRLLRAMHGSMLVLADRNVATRPDSARSPRPVRGRSGAGDLRP
jgi:Insertion element 4 transposase N-terminal